MFTAILTLFNTYSKLDSLPNHVSHLHFTPEYHLLLEKPCQYLIYLTNLTTYVDNTNHIIPLLLSYLIDPYKTFSDFLLTHFTPLTIN